MQILLRTRFHSRLSSSMWYRLQSVSGDLPVLQHGCFSGNLTDMGLHGSVSYVLNSLCNMTAEDGNVFLVGVPCVLVNARTLLMLSCSHCSGCTFWTVLRSFFGMPGL